MVTYAVANAASASAPSRGLPAGRTSSDGAACRRAQEALGVAPGDNVICVRI
jgi:hypothetical protein